MSINYSPIGVIHSPFTHLEDMPIQPVGAGDFQGTIEIYPQYAEGLRDLAGFSAIIVLTHLHRSGESRLVVTPFLDTQERGVFATRSPRRPNPIGLSVMRLLRVEENIVHVSHVDILDGTPVLDIKPYVPDFDFAADVRTGWLEGISPEARRKRSDGRFR